MAALRCIYIESQCVGAQFATAGSRLSRGRMAQSQQVLRGKIGIRWVKSVGRGIEPLAEELPKRRCATGLTIRDDRVAVEQMKRQQVGAVEELRAIESSTCGVQAEVGEPVLHIVNRGGCSGEGLRSAPSPHHLLPAPYSRLRHRLVDHYSVEAVTSLRHDIRLKPDRNPLGPGSNLRTLSACRSGATSRTVIQAKFGHGINGLSTVSGAVTS